jgi:flagellar hook-length control protein FliK
MVTPVPVAVAPVQPDVMPATTPAVPVVSEGANNTTVSTKPIAAQAAAQSTAQPTSPTNAAISVTPETTVDATAGPTTTAAKTAAPDATKALDEPTAGVTTVKTPPTASAGATDGTKPADASFAAAMDDIAVPVDAKASVKTAGKPTSDTKTRIAATDTTATAAKAATTKTADQTANPSHDMQPGHANTAQQSNAGKQDAEQVTEPEKGNGNAGPASSAHDHAGVQANRSDALPSTDASAQAAATLQPQLSAPAVSAVPISAANLTATAAASAAVPLSGLAVEIAASALNGKSRFDIRLDPADLGRIDVRIDVDRSGQITSHLRVEKPETLSMLQQSAPQLQQALQDAGLKTSGGGLQFSLRDQNSSGQNGNDNQQNGNTQRLIVTDDETVPAQLVGRSYGRMFGSQGGVDIRV